MGQSPVAAPSLFEAGAARLEFGPGGLSPSFGGRLVYQVVKAEKTAKVLRIWTRYE
jgi:hypothetical protein